MQKAQHGESETQLQRACRKLWTVTLELPEFDSTAYVRRAVSRAMTLPLRIRERAAGGDDDGFKPRLASIPDEPACAQRLAFRSVSGLCTQLPS